MTVKQVGTIVRIMDTKDLRDKLVSNITGDEAQELGRQLSELSDMLMVAGKKAKTQEIIRTGMRRIVMANADNESIAREVTNEMLQQLL